MSWWPTRVRASTTSDEPRVCRARWWRRCRWPPQTSDRCPEFELMALTVATMAVVPAQVHVHGEAGSWTRGTARQGAAAAPLIATATVRPNPKQLEKLLHGNSRAHAVEVDTGDADSSLAPGGSAVKSRKDRSVLTIPIGNAERRTTTPKAHSPLTFDMRHVRALSPSQSSRGEWRTGKTPPTRRSRNSNYGSTRTSRSRRQLKQDERWASSAGAWGIIPNPRSIGPF